MTKSKCLVPKCKTESTQRGLCGSHYSVAYCLVKSGKTTWEVLESKGKVYQKKVGLTAEAREWFLK